MLELNELCDLCWDDHKREVTAIEIVAGIPMCADHKNSLSTKQSRFEENRDDDEIEVALKNKPEQETKKMNAPNNMTRKVSNNGNGNNGELKSSLVARRGIVTAFDFADFMSALMCDLVDGNIAPEVAESACWAGDRLLKVVEMQHRLGKEIKEGEKILKLTGNRE